MNPTASAYEAALHPLLTVVDAVPVAAWERLSPCSDWTARDVIDHIIATQRDLLVGHGHDLGAMPDLSDPAAGLRSLVQFYVWDMLVHRWDIARAAGGDETLTPAELDRIEAGADSFGDALHMDGICGPAVSSPAGADRQVELLGLLGRDASVAA